MAERALETMGLWPEDAAEIPGLKVLRARLGPEAQASLLAEVEAVTLEAPPVRPVTRSGSPFRITMTCAGRVGWVSDRGGYRYEERHPVTGRPWPPIPPGALALARACASEAGFSGYEPETCLVNFYPPGGRLGMHRDDDEADLAAPIVSVSLGDACVFRFGGAGKRDPWRDFVLRSGDVVVFGGPARLAWHGVPRTFPGTGAHPGGGRVNLTFRRVGAAT